MTIHRLTLPLLLAAILGGGSPLSAQRETVVRVTPGQPFLDLKVGDTASQEIVIEGSKGARLDPGRHKLQSKAEDLEVARSELKDGRLMVTALKVGGTKVRITVDDVNSWVIVKVLESTQHTVLGSETPPAPATAPSAAPSPSPIVGFDLSDTLLTLLPGESGRLTAHALGPDRAVLPATIRYRSVDREKVEVDSSGEVLARSPGRVGITIDVPGTDHVALVNVVVVDGALTPERDTLHLTPIGRDTVLVIAPGMGGRGYRGKLAWYSTDESVVQVDSSSGELTPVAPGDAQVRTRLPGRELSVSVRVYPQPPFVLPPQEDGKLVKVPLEGGWKSVFVATRDTMNPPRDTLFLMPVRYEIEDTTIAKWDGVQRALVGRRIGKTSVAVRTILHGAKQLTWLWPVQVQGGSIRAGPTRRGYLVGQRDTMQAVMVDSAKGAGDPVTLTWQTSRPKVMREVMPGILEAIGPGRSTITGTSEWDSAVTITALVVPDLVFAVARQTTSGTRFSSLFGMHLSDRSFAEIAPSAAIDVEPAVSPDRTLIAFARVDFRRKDIWLMDVDSANPRNITPDTLMESNPEWSPDGRRLYYQVATAKGVRVFAMEMGSESVHAVGDTGRSVQSFAISSDGKWLLYSATGREDQTDLFPVWLGPGPRPGDPPWPLLNTRDNETAPVFATRSGDLYFVRRSRGNKQGTSLMRCRPHCQAVEQVLVVPGNLFDYAVSPDGNHVVLSLAIEDPKTRKLTRGIYLLDPGAATGPIGQALYPINAGEAGSPAFTP